MVFTRISFAKDKIGASFYHSETDTFEYYFNERINCRFPRTGDIFSSVLVGAILIGKTAIEAVTIAVDFLVDTIKKTIDDIKTHFYGVKLEKAILGLIRMLEKN